MLASRQDLLLAAAVAIAAWASPSAALAETVGAPLRIGIFGGYHGTSGDFDVSGARTTAGQPTTSGIGGLRLGWHVSRWFELELTAGIVPAPTRASDETAILLPIHGDAVVRFLHGVVRPYVAVGGGVFALAGPGSDADALLHGAVGVEFVIDRAVGIRLEAGLYGTDGVVDAMSLTPVVTLGVDLLAWRDSRDRVDEDDHVALPPRPTPIAGATPEDRDGDGVANGADECPDHAGPRAFGGCPDSDRDGVLDPFDRCPLEPAADGPGTERLAGCPDSDGDTVPDIDDACILHAGDPKRYGCAAPE